MNKKICAIIKMLLLFIATLAFQGAYAQESGDEVSVQELQKEMTQKTADVENVSCDFVQKKHLQFLDEVVTSDGKLFFDKNNRLRWEYVSPYEYLIVINNGKFSIKNDGKVSEFDTNSNKVFTQISDLIVKSVNGTIFTSPEFNVKAYKDKDEYIIYLEPNIQEMKDVLSRIKLCINEEDFSVNRVFLYEKEDNFTEITFKNKKFNASLPESTFSCN